MKQLAVKADERWKSVPSFLDSPQRQQPEPAIGVTDSKPADPSQTLGSDGMPTAVQSEVEAKGDVMAPEQEVGREARPKQKKENPWERPQQGAPGENWQPAAWSPGVAQRR